jgi:hypothetical protein
MPELIHEIAKKAVTNKAVNWTEFLQYYMKWMDNYITGGWLGLLLTYHGDPFGEARNVPKQVRDSVVEAAIEAFLEHVHHLYAELVFNLAKLISANGKIALR